MSQTCQLRTHSWQRPNIGSRVTREGHARFWERPGVKFLPGDSPEAAGWLTAPRDRRSFECVAKLDAEQRASNNRIRLNGLLNRCCALVFVLESMLLIWVVEIVLQHNPLDSRHCSYDHGTRSEIIGGCSAIRTMTGYGTAGAV